MRHDNGQPQRVALLDPGDFGARYNVELAEALIRNGCEVQLFSEARNREALYAGYRQSHFYKPLAGAAGRRLPKAAARALKGLCHLPDMARLRPVLAAFDADVLHCQWAPLPLLDKWAFRWLRRRVPIVFTLHDTNAYNGSGRALMRAGHEDLLREVDAIIVHTRQALNRLIERGIDPARVQRVPHGLISARADSHHRTERSVPDRLALLLVGKIKAYKGVDVLLRALAQLPADARGRFVVHIVGEPHMDTEPFQTFVAEQGLREIVQLRFEFISEAEMARLIEEADAMVLPYREIDASGIAMRAVASGLPVLASAIEGFVELFAGDAGARLVPPNNPEALAGVLREWAEMPQALFDLRSAMQRRRELYPSWDEIAEQTRAIYGQARSHWMQDWRVVEKFGFGEANS